MTIIHPHTAREALKHFGDSVEAARALGVNEAVIWNSLPADRHEWSRDLSAAAKSWARPVLPGRHQP